MEVSTGQSWTHLRGHSLTTGGPGLPQRTRDGTSFLWPNEAQGLLGTYRFTASRALQKPTLLAEVSQTLRLWLTDFIVKSQKF